MILSIRGEIGAGKTTVAQHLVDQWNFRRVSFAEPLKVEVYDALRSGNPPTSMPVKFWPASYHWELAAFPAVEDPADEVKVLWVNQNKVVLGPLLQWWGTEYRRGQNDSYWIDKFQQKAQRYLASGYSVVTDDARFDNELDTICEMRGKHVFLLSRNSKQNAENRNGGSENRDMNHASEKLNDPFDKRHFTVLGNFGSVADLIRLADGLVLALQGVYRYPNAA